MLNFPFLTKQSVYFIPGWSLGYEVLSPSLFRNLPSLEFLHLPGYAGSKYIAEFDLAVDSLVEQLPDTPVILGGWSLGAILALAIAARYPQRIKQLFLIAATPCFISKPTNDKFPAWNCATDSKVLNDFKEQIQNSSAEEFAVLQGRFIGGFNRGDKFAKQIKKYLLENCQKNIEKDVLLTGLDWLATQDLRNEIKNITAQVYLEHGIMDSLIPIEAARWLANSINQSTQITQSAVQQCILHEIPERAHAPFIELELSNSVRS